MYIDHWKNDRIRQLRAVLIIGLLLYMGVHYSGILGYLVYPNLRWKWDKKAINLVALNTPVLTYERQYGMSRPEEYADSRLLTEETNADVWELFADAEYSHDREIAENGVDLQVDDHKTQNEATQRTVAQSTESQVIETASIAASDIHMDGGLNPVYTRNQLSDFNFLMDHCYTVDSTTYVDANEMNADTLLSMDMSIQPDTDDYQILIYHTHSSSETFADSRPGVLEDTPIGLGDTLTSLLEGYGYKVYHDRTVYDQINGKVDRNYAYTASGEAIDQILAEHPSIEVVIDLHRDGLNPHTHLVTEINGKPTAKIMFFNGVSRTVRNGELDYLYNPNRQANLAFSLQMYLTGEAMYDDYLRNIYIKGYQYNLDRRPKATLIEVGGQTNTVEEANNAMEPLAEILHRVLSGERAWE